MSGNLEKKICPKCNLINNSGMFHTCLVEFECNLCGHKANNSSDLLIHTELCEAKKKLKQQSDAITHRAEEVGGYFKDPRKDPINHPSHYNSGKIEVIDFIDDQKLNFSRGCVVKYVSRAKHKGNELEDLKKAMWYLQHEIELVEKGEG